ncbi:pectinesterase 2-like [Alnus glutinosa]|uniref:pectinesterase 2-like n=1 Tax=Alnus glutinosa TaxID=3517 RepID=UPI002D77044A|nr:pectinesterase 2-like [Alnus glutinosa]
MAKKLTSSTKELVIALSILLAITWTSHGDKMPDFDLVVAQDRSGIHADGFVAKFISFENTAGAENMQAVALASESSYSAYYRCRFIGFQDTLYAKREIQFFRECEIYGTVDFIFGDARVVFQNCKILARKPLPGQSNTITAQGRESTESIGGFVIHNCTLTAAPDLLTSNYPVKTYLGRPWKDYSRTVIMESFLDVLIDAQGWLEWEGKPTRSNTLYYVEYNNQGPSADTYNRVNWTGYRVISSPMEAIAFTVRTFISGDTWIPSTEVPY